MGGSSNPIKAVVDTAVKAVTDTVDEAERITGSGGIHLDPFVKQKEEAKEEARKDAKQQADALAQQEVDKQNQLKVKAANKEAGEGSSIILGGKRKKGKKGTVSSGMGLSTGSTGLQT